MPAGVTSVGVSSRDRADDADVDAVHVDRPSYSGSAGSPVPSS